VAIDLARPRVDEPFVSTVQSLEEVDGPLDVRLDVLVDAMERLAYVGEGGQVKDELGLDGGDVLHRRPVRDARLDDRDVAYDVGEADGQQRRHRVRHGEDVRPIGEQAAHDMRPDEA